jgi:hypothetical protein
MRTSSFLRRMILTLSLIGFLGGATSCVVVPNKKGSSRHHVKKAKHKHNHCHYKGGKHKQRKCHSHMHKHPHH